MHAPVWLTEFLAALADWWREVLREPTDAERQFFNEW